VVELLSLIIILYQDYIDNGREYIEKIKLPGSKRILVFMFKNSKKYKISAELKYDLHV
jgi:hypothetical protein